MLTTHKVLKVGSDRVVVISDSVFPKEKDKIIYCMVCPQGNYTTRSWLALGWTIFTHRLWHLFKDRKWTD